MLTLQSKRLLLFALTIDQLNLAMHHPDALADQLQIQLDAEIFGEDSRQAMMVKMSRMGHVDAGLHPWYTYFLIVDAAARRAMGVCGFKGAPNSLTGSAEVGYAIHPDFRNQGYMTETVIALEEWAFQQPICEQVTGETLPENLASQRVLQKAGMTLARATERMLFWAIDKKTFRQAHGG